MHRRYISAAVAVLGITAAAASARAAHAGPTSTIAFGEPTVSGVQADGYEQDIELDTTGKSEIIYTSSPVATGAVSVIWRSTDGGQTFKWVPGQVTPAGKPITCVGGGDSELAVDKAGHLYFADLWAGNFSTARSDDHGATWPSASCAGVPDAGVDRQWYTTVGDPTSGKGTDALFLTYDRLDQGVAACPGATNAGNALVIARSPAFGQPASTAGSQFSPSLALSCDEGIMGNDVSYTYPDAGPRVFVIHDNAAIDDISVDRCDDVASSASNPAGLANCTGDKVIASFPGKFTGANFPTISVDDHGGLFAVWEETPGTKRGTGITGNTQLYFSTSNDEGSTWSAPAPIPTPGVNQAVYAWPASGDPGRVDVAFYGAPEAWSAHDPNLNNGPDAAGPDSIVGHYSLYLVQTLDGGRTWSPPVDASEHFIHYGSMYTLPGSQSGDRALGDFLRVRTGPNGEAEISYADSNNFEAASDLSPQGMYVRQVAGPSLYARVGTIRGALPPPGPCVKTANDHQATWDANGTSSGDVAHLHLQSVCVGEDSLNYVFTIRVADLTSLGPDPSAGGTTNIWQVLWHTPSLTEQPDGGELWFVYMESVDGGAPTCWTGQSSQEPIGPAGAEITYPGTTQLTGSACTYTAAAPGTITITVPKADVADAGALNDTLYSVTASTQTLPSGNAESPPATNTQGLGVVAGQLPNLVDVAPAFDFTPAAPVRTPEAPWVPVLLLTGTLAAAAGAAARRRRRAARGGLRRRPAWLASGPRA